MLHGCTNGCQSLIIGIYSEHPCLINMVSMVWHDRNVWMLYNVRINVLRWYKYECPMMVARHLWKPYNGTAGVKALHLYGWCECPKLVRQVLMAYNDRACLYALFDYKCALLITYYPDNNKRTLHTQFLVWGPPVLFGSVHQTSPTERPKFE